MLRAVEDFTSEEKLITCECYEFLKINICTFNWVVYCDIVLRFSEKDVCFLTYMCTS